MSRSVPVSDRPVVRICDARPIRAGSWLVLIAAVCVVGPADPARAADKMLDLAVADAKASSHAKALLDVPFFMAGEKHPAVGRKLGEWPTNQRTNAFAKSKTDACHRVFVSAIRSLQLRAQNEGGDAIVDVRSTTKDQPLESATQFRCAAGAAVANVSLTGTVVKLAGK